MVGKSAFLFPKSLFSTPSLDFVTQPIGFVHEEKFATTAKGTLGPEYCIKKLPILSAFCHFCRRRVNIAVVVSARRFTRAIHSLKVRCGHNNDVDAVLLGA